MRWRRWRWFEFRRRLRNWRQLESDEVGSGQLGIKFNSRRRNLKMDFKGYFLKKKFSTGQVIGLLATVFLGITALAYAAVTIPHTFHSGTTASANEVNENFQALADAINNRTTATLEGMAGTWIYAMNASYLRSGNTLCTYSKSGILTLNSNGTFSDIQDDTNDYCHGIGVITSTGGTFTGTWTVSANGAGALTYPSEGATLSFRVSKELNLMISKWTSNSSTVTVTYLRQ